MKGLKQLQNAHKILQKMARTMLICISSLFFCFLFSFSVAIQSSCKTGRETEHSEARTADSDIPNLSKSPKSTPNLGERRGNGEDLGKRSNTEGPDPSRRPPPKMGGSAGEVVNKTSLPADKLLSLLNPENRPTYQGETGAVEGQIYVVGPPAPKTDFRYGKCEKAKTMYNTLFRTGALRPLNEASTPDQLETRELADAVVVITDHVGFVAETQTTVDLDIHDCTYQKRTVVLTLGQQLDVYNRDPRGQSNYYSVSLARDPNVILMLAPPGGDPIHFAPTRTGRDMLFDKLGHNFMQADLFVIVNPLHAVSDESGHFRIEKVPIGSLTLHTMHPAFAGESETKIEVKTNEVTRADLVLRYAPDPIQKEKTKTSSSKR